MSKLYRDYLKELGSNYPAWSNLPNLSLTNGKWNWLVLVKYEKNKPQKALVKVVAKLDGNECNLGQNVVENYIHPDFTQNPGASSIPTVYDPTGVAILCENGNDVRSVLLDCMGIMPNHPQIIHTYSWKHEAETMWNLIGLVPFVPPMDPDGICWYGKYLDDYYLSAVKYPQVLEKVLVATMRLGYVVGEFDFNSDKDGILVKKFLNGLTVELKVGSNAGVNYGKSEVEITIDTKDSKDTITTNHFVLYVLK